jgi:protein-S-isoprenylcysteine O-methyltransferase Ste14
MRRDYSFLARAALVVVIWLIWWGTGEVRLSNAANLGVIVGGVLLTFPLVWVGRRILDRRRQSAGQAAWVTTFVHFGLGFTFGVPIVRAAITYPDWRGWLIPVPQAISLVLVIVTGAAVLLTMVNLALKGFGAPFFIALSKKLAVDWMYAWTRNPMVLAGLVFLLALGLWFQSTLFFVWALLLFTPALLFFVKVYEERELEIRFGSSYLEYKARTPVLFPRKPKG